MTESSSEYDSSDDVGFGWVNNFLSLKGNEFFCEVDEDWIQDKFNLTGLVSQVPLYDFAMHMICDIDTDREFKRKQLDKIRRDAEVLYGLIHSRYILTNRGFNAMVDKFEHGVFGSCPRVLCEHQSLLPVGLFERTGKDSVKLFCARCKEVYNCSYSRHDKIDGAYFGTTFPHLFFLVFPELQPRDSKQSYIPPVVELKLPSTSHERALEAAQKLMEAQREKHRLK